MGGARIEEGVSCHSDDTGDWERCAFVDDDLEPAICGDDSLDKHLANLSVRLLPTKKLGPREIKCREALIIADWTIESHFTWYN